MKSSLGRKRILQNAAYWSSMVSYQLICIAYHRAILRFVLLPLVGLLSFCVPSHAQTVQKDNKSAALFGHVTQSGVPVASATVKAYEEVNNGSYLHLDGKCSSETNKAGQYLCRGLSAGRYLLSIQMQGKSAQSTSTAALAFYYQTALWPMPSPSVFVRGKVSSSR
jgi:hypothetical protein